MLNHRSSSKSTEALGRNLDSIKVVKTATFPLLLGRNMVIGVALGATFPYAIGSGSTGESDWRAPWASYRDMVALDPGVAADARTGRADTGWLGAMVHKT